MFAGTHFGRYEIRSKIGEGGMGEVYSALDTELDREVAIKLLPTEFSSDEERRLRFRQEARVVSSLNHPNVITIYEIGENDHGQFLATEFVEGKTLREVIKTESLTLTRILRIVEQTANALVAAHHEGIVHRDIKPENIMVRGDGIVKVLDFGLAKPIAGYRSGRDSSENNTMPGIVLGSVKYMSPEQARGLDIDPRTDIWSVGIVLYEMLVGRTPFEGSTAADTIAGVIYQEPRPITDLLPGVPAELQRIIRKALQKERDERYQDIKDLALDIKQLLLEVEIANSGSKIGSANGLHAFNGNVISENPTVLHRTIIGDLQTFSSSLNTAVTSYNAPRRRSGLSWLAGLGLVVIGLLLLLAGIELYSSRNTPGPLAPTAFERPQINRINTDGRVVLPVISPDGKYVAYVAGEFGSRSLVVRQIATDSVVTIVPPTALNIRSVTFSPTGDHVYYSVASPDYAVNTLYQVPTLGGTPKKLIEDVDSAVTFSPDGKQFAFVRHRSEPNEDVIIVANSDDLSMQPLITSSEAGYDFFAFRLAWSPDGNRILGSAGKRESGFVTGMNVVEIAIGTKAVRQVNKREFFVVTNVAWFSDGSGYIFTGREVQNGPNQIWRAVYGEHGEVQVTNDFNDYVDISLSSDGQNLVTLKADNFSSLWRYSPSSKSNVQLTTESRDLEGLYGMLQRQDGKLVYSRNQGKEIGIWLADADGKNARAFYTEPGFSVMPVMTPDGRYVIFNVQRDKTSRIWRANADGSGLVRLTDENNDHADLDPQVTADGKFVIFQRKLANSDRFLLMRIPVEGGVAETFYQNENFSIFQPRISPDGRRIAYTTYDVRTLQKKLVIATIDNGTFGKVEQELEYNLINQYAWSPDNRSLTISTSRGGAQNLWRQPLNGREPTQITDFKTGKILNFAWTRDGRELLISRGNTNNDLILIRDSQRQATQAASIEPARSRTSFNLFRRVTQVFY